MLLFDGSYEQPRSRDLPHSLMKKDKLSTFYAHLAVLRLGF